jgi:hypothetical protein
MLAQAAEEGYDTSGNRTPYHGYYYRMLPSVGGFGFVAFPADYRSSGVMTFVVNQKGIEQLKRITDEVRNAPHNPR